MRIFRKVIAESKNNNVMKPTRKTKFSAGYDFYSPVTLKIWPGDTKTIPTGIKCYMNDNEYLQLSMRSRLANSGLIMPNSIGIIYADYVDNTTNEGNISFIFTNISSDIVVIACGERIGQGIFLDYNVTDDDEDYKETRSGGFGSTGA